MEEAVNNRIRKMVKEDEEEEVKMMKNIMEMEGSPLEINAGKEIKGIAYHQNLNVILVANEDGVFHVVDPTLRSLLYVTPTHDQGESTSKDWNFDVVGEKVVVVEKNSVGIRTEYNGGILLLGSMLQTPVKSSNDKVQIELSKGEAEGLCHSLSSLDSSSDPEIAQVQKQLKELISTKEVEASSPMFCTKKEKWNTVKLELPHGLIRNCVQTLVNELVKKNRYVPQLSVASSILERLNMLHSTLNGDSSTLDKTQMFSEASRLNTFANWPHADYKWALPDKMAQAGFYHNPSANGEDRALCFSCNVCLVSWEPTDEPWSEHERHSPYCPFVKGEHTHNVPLSLSFATAPASQIQKTSIGSPILGYSSTPCATVVGYTNGYVVVYEIVKQPKEVVQIEVTPKDVTSRLRPQSGSISSYCDVALKPKEAWVLDTSEKLGSDASGLAMESLQYNVNSKESVEISAVAILGAPAGSGHIPPPSVIVGGSLKREILPGQGPDDNMNEISPFLLVYGLGRNIINLGASEDKLQDEVYTNSGSTGTKQETQAYDEDAFTSYISEAELLSDSVSIFSDLNVGESPAFLEFSSVPPPVPVSTKGAAVAKKKNTNTSEAPKAPEKSSTPVPASVLLQHICLPPQDKLLSMKVISVLPSIEGNQLIVILSASAADLSSIAENQAVGLVLSYKICSDGQVVRVAKEPTSVQHIFDRDQLIVKSCFIVPDSGEPFLATALCNGEVWLRKMDDLTVAHIVRRTGQTAGIVKTMAYVSSLERLCCGTSKGTLEFYCIGDRDPNMLKSKNSSVTSSNVQVPDIPPDDPSLLSNQPLNLTSLNSLLSLTNFENVKPFFSANVASCWLKVIQAQKERKHPQHLQHNETELNGSTLTWRLQKNKFSKKEHIFEITLPKSTRIGHLDFKFSLQAGCSIVQFPSIQISLYRALHKNKPDGAEGKKIDFETNKSTNEFLNSINTELVCGPLELASYLDLSGQGGSVVMTSPSLILERGRNFYLHIQAKGKLDEPLPKSDAASASNSASNLAPNKKSNVTPVDKQKEKAKFQGIKTHVKSSWGKDEFSVEFIPASLHFGAHGTPHMPHPMMYPMGVHHKTPCPVSGGLNPGHGAVNIDDNKKRDFVGCDWLNEVSISIRQVKSSTLTNEDSERSGLLVSEHVFRTLLRVAVMENDEGNYTSQKLALDLLVWIGAVNLSSPPVGSASYQQKFIRCVEEKLEALVMQCILTGDRATAHKCAKLLVMCIDASENYQDNEELNFSNCLLSALLNLVQYVISCSSAGSLQWYFLLLNRVRGENLGWASQTLLNILLEVSNELKKRSDPLHSLLRTRFGLYGTPLEPELFELEIPPVTKSYSHPLTYAGLYGAEAMNNGASGSGTFHLWGLKDVDFRDLLVGNPMSLKWGKLGSLSPKQQIQGLLEVEPLHFTCHAASDGTRIEKIDLGITSSSFSSVPMPAPYQPTSTNLQTGEGSKKSEPEKMDHMMMIQKALKMDAPDVMFDYIDNLGGYKGGSGAWVEVPYSNSPDLLAALGQIPNSVLTMVMKQPNSSATGSASTGKIAPVYAPVPVFHSVGMPTLAYPSSGSQSVIPSSAAVMSKPSVISKESTSSITKAITSVTTAAGADSGGKQEASNDGLKLLLSPWQQMMYVPPQQAIVIDRMHSGARRFVVLDFGAPVLLTDMIIPSCSDLVSLSVDIWLHREDTDGQRLVVATDIGVRTLVVSDLQPAAVCRYLKITVIGRYGMGTTKCKIPLGLFYGHTTILPTDVPSRGIIPSDVSILTTANIQTHLSVLSYLLEDIGCRYQLACSKLRRLLDPLLKPEISPIDHISYYLPKGKERNKLGLNSSTDQSILSAYQECITLQQQLNVTKNVVRRLQKSLAPYSVVTAKHYESLTEISSDKIHIITEFLIESLLGISMVLPTAALSNTVNSTSISIYAQMNQEMCEALFQNICVLENGQCQLSCCMLMLRACGFQPWWGRFLSSTLRSLFSAGSTILFPQDRVFILLVFLGQKALLNWQNSRVLESALELLMEVLDPIETTHGFLSSKLDMTLLGWVMMYLCLCLDGVNCTLDSSETGKKGKDSYKSDKQVACVSSRWDFIQGESALYRKVLGPSKPQEYGGFRRRIQKKMLAAKQKLEDLDNMTTGLTQPLSQPVGLGMQLSALGNKIEAIKQKQASVGKNIKLQSSKHFKDLLHMRRSEILSKRNGSSQKEDKDGCPTSDVEIKLNLDHKLCLQVSKRLGILLLRMDSTCHSDVFLITCKSLARISTACRPVVSLGAIFNTEGIIDLILNGVGSDFIRQRNWSSSWVSHAVMCLIQDILEAEKLFPPSGGESELAPEVDIGESGNSTFTEDIMSGMVDTSTPLNTSTTEDMVTDEADASINEASNASVPMDVCSGSGESDESDLEDITMEFAANIEHLKTAVQHQKKISSSKRVGSCTTSISSALDARLESGVESTTEIRLRMMAVVDSEVLNQSLKAPIEVPSEFLKNRKNLSEEPAGKSTAPAAPPVSSSQLLSDCFEKIFQMMAAENCSVSIEKVLQLWMSINTELSSGSHTSTDIKPIVPLSCASVSSLMAAFTKNSGIGIQEWGLAFKVLHLVSNQRPLNCTDGMWVYIMSDKCFPEMILRFISGSGMRLQKNHIVSAGPTVCQHFYNFLLRLRQLSADTPWTPCLKEILLRVLSLFLSGPFTTADFPIDAFNKFLDRLTCPDLSYVNPATVISLMQQMAQILHQYVFSPNKLKVKPGGEMKSIHSTCSSTNGNGDIKPAKPHTFEHVVFRLTCFMASFVSLPYKTTSTSEKCVQDFLAQMSKSFQLTECENALIHYLAKCGEMRPKTIADIVLQMESTMMRILSVLANPNNINVLVSGDLVTAFNIMETSAPTTVVDAVIHLFCKLQGSTSSSKWVIQPIFKFLAKTPFDDFCCPYIVSETFVLMVLKVINTEENLKQFVELKCVEAICNKFVISARRFFSSCPTFVSILAQYIGRTDANAMFGAGAKKLNNEPIEIQEGQINVAPLGTISSTNFSAHPSEVLLQSTPPHRRARSPVWSYHFFPEETYLELVITLPCAVLLREVHIIPHMTSLSTCPSAIMVEISRDQNSSSTLPMGPPVNTSGMSNIIIQLIQPEVSKTVLLRLFKPKDSSNLGLSQIRLLGSTTFSCAALQGLSNTESVKSFESSAHWLYILDRTIQVSEGNNMLRRRIIETSVNIPDVLESCYSMLIAPVANGKARDIYLPHLASVLFQFGSLRQEVSKQLMEALLGPVQMGFTNGMVATTSTAAGLSQLGIVVELLHKLCCDIPQWGIRNLTTVMAWLEACADQYIQFISNSIAAPEYFQAIASSMWQITSVGKTDISDICTAKLFTKLYKWSLKLDGRSELKISLDHIMCSMCYCKPWLFISLLTRMQILKPMDWVENTGSIEDMVFQWYEEDSVWDRLQLEELSTIRSVMTPSKLMTIGRVSQSPVASRLLKQSSFLLLLNSCIMDFWDYVTKKFANVVEKDKPAASTDFLVSVLTFYTELCNINDVKTWFGKEGSGWWLPILKLLSSLPGPLKAAFFGTNKSVYELETVVIQFLAKCCWSHPDNQKIIAACLRDIIISQKSSPHKAVFLHSMSSFCRRLLIQLLLENEKIIVHVKSSSKYPLKIPSDTLSLRDKHPSMGVNGGDRLFFMSTHSTAYDLVNLIEPQGVKMEKLGIAAAEPNRFLSMLKKEQGLIDAGLEMIDQMQLAMQSGNAAKDKRAPADPKRPIKMASKKLKPEGVGSSSDSRLSNGDGDKIKGPTLILETEEFPDVKIPSNLSIASLLAAVRQQKPDAFLDVLVFTVRTEIGAVFTSRATLSPSTSSSSMADIEEACGVGEVALPPNQLLLPKEKETIPGVFNIDPLPSTVEVFSMMGGLGLLAKHLPVVYPETLKQIAVGSKFTGSVGVVMNVDKDSPMMADDWVKVEAADDFYDEMLDSMVTSTPLAKRAPGIRQITVTPGIPPHSMAAFGLFLSLPRFSEILLGERVGAQCMLRLVMGVTDDADGNDIFNSAVAKTLPTLPFEVLRCLLDALPLTAEEGRNLRRVMVDVSAVHFILACLAVFTHQDCDPSLVPGLQHELVIAATKAQSGQTVVDGKSAPKSDDKSHVYWAKGTGFGTGSTAQSWDVEMAIQKKKNEEENVTCLLHLMSSYINPKIQRNTSSKENAPPENVTSVEALPTEVMDLLRSSCLFNAIAGYLRNDSVLDMSRHVPLYKAVLEFLRALVSSSQLLPLLAPWERKSKSNDEQCISKLLSKMKEVVDNYSRRLTSNMKGKGKNKSSTKVVDELDDEGLAILIPDIQTTATMVETAVGGLGKHSDDIEMSEENMDSSLLVSKTLDQRYIEEMKKLQFAFYEMITEEDESDNPSGGIRFTVPYHYESNVRNNWGRSSATRLKRLAQESVTLSSSLPLAFGSTIFVRCDNDRLDVMKVLITGPVGTPYANGCFEFDVFFPNDYPQSPMLINLETNGRQRVRFNPNLYTDGKVCLSILNTWHGRPEEKWNPQTSSLLPVLVAIQSLILNAEPYFNEPGYEKSRGTDQGERNNREYNVGIQIATVEWAMLDQLRHPSPCFKDVIQRHFWMKRTEVLAQLDKWLEEITDTCRTDKRAGKSVVGSADPVQVFKNNYAILKKELLSIKPPSGLEDLAESCPSDNTSSSSTESASSSLSTTSEKQSTQESGSGEQESPSPSIEPKAKLELPEPTKTNTQENEDEKMSIDV